MTRSMSWVLAVVAIAIVGCQSQSGATPAESSTLLSGGTPVVALDLRGDAITLVIADGRNGNVVHSQEVGDGAAATAWRQDMVAVAEPAIDHTSARIGIQRLDGQRVSDFVAQPFPQYPGVLRFKPLGFTGDGRYLVAEYVEAIGGTPVSWGFGSWSVADGTQIGTIEQDNCGVANIVDAPGSRVVALCLGSGDLIWIDAASSSATSTVRLPGESEGYRRAKGDQVFGPVVDGDQVFAATERGDVFSYEVNGAAPVKHYRVPLLQLDRVVGIVVERAGVVVAVGSRESQGLSDAIGRLVMLSKQNGEVLASRELDPTAAFMVGAGDGTVVVPFPSGVAWRFGGLDLQPSGSFQFAEQLISAPFEIDGGQEQP